MLELSLAERIDILKTRTTVISRNWHTGIIIRRQVRRDMSPHRQSVRREGRPISPRNMQHLHFDIFGTLTHTHTQ